MGQYYQSSKNQHQKKETIIYLGSIISYSISIKWWEGWEKKEIYLVCGNFPPFEKWDSHQQF
jgi:hypothetical protein